MTVLSEVTFGAGMLERRKLAGKAVWDKGYGAAFFATT